MYKAYPPMQGHHVTFETLNTYACTLEHKTHSWGNIYQCTSLAQGFNGGAFNKHRIY